MFVLLLILASLTTVATLLAGGVWHLSRAYRDQYREDCCVPPPKSILPRLSTRKAKGSHRARRRSTRTMRAIA